MPTFIRPERQTPCLPPDGKWPTPAADATCPRCSATARGWGESDAQAEGDACRRLTAVCTCRGETRFLVDGTPTGFTLWFDGLGGLKRGHLYHGLVYTFVGPIEPGGLPLILCTDDRPPPYGRKSGEAARRRRVAFDERVRTVAALFRRKQFWVQVAHQEPTNTSGELLPPHTPEKVK